MASVAARPGPGFFKRPTWRYDGALLAAQSPQTYTLAASGAAVASGSAVLAQVMALAATGAQAASGAADLNIVMGLAASGAATGSGSAVLAMGLALAASGVGTSSGSAELLFVIFTLGFFSSQQERAGPYNRPRPYWRYERPVSAGVPLSPDISLGGGKRCQ